jgi:hypothetical protein
MSPGTPGELAWITMISLIVIAIFIVLSWLRVGRPSRQSMSGAVVLDTGIPLLARIRMHFVACTVVLAAAVLLVAFGDLPWWGPFVALSSNVGLVALPIRYRLTTDGIRVGWTPFRRWTEFAGVARAPGGARLQGVAGSRDKRVWLSASRGDDEFLQFLRRMIRNAYQGRNVLVDFPPKSGESPGKAAASTDITSTAM